MRSNWHRRGAFATSLMGLGILCLLMAAGQARLGAAEASAGSAQTINLEYRELASNCINWGLTFAPQPDPFPKEPDFGKRHVFRGRLSLGSDTNQALPFAWDYAQGKLYLDLNRNRDLTDDPQGVHSLPAQQLLARDENYAYQTFPGVMLRLETPAGSERLLVDLSLNHYRTGLNCFAGIRSYWDGKLTLQGQDWQIGIVENVQGRLGAGEAAYLVLRPWSARDEPFNVVSGSLDVFSFTRHLFFLGQAYELTCASKSEDGVCRHQLTLTPLSPRLGVLRMAGQHLKRVVLSGGAYTVVLDKPEPLVSVPVGHYAQCRVHLKQGRTEACLDPLPGNPFKAVAVGEDRSGVLTLGGPLTNAVTVTSRANKLVLGYRLVGADGQSYRLLAQNRTKPPSFKVYKGSRAIASGKFEFG